MNRSMDKLRVIGGLFLLSNVLAVFLPVVYIRQENYPEQVYSQFSFIRGYLVPGSGAEVISASGGTRFLVVLLILLPLLFSISAGVCSFLRIVNGEYTAIGGLAAGLLYICQILLSGCFWPDRRNDAQEYVRGIGWWYVLLSACVLLVIEGIFLWIAMHPPKDTLSTDMDLSWQKNDAAILPESAERKRGRIPASSSVPAAHLQDDDAVSYTQTDPARHMGAVAENPVLSQTQTEINLSLDTGMTASRRNETDSVLPSRGVMVGMSGVFAGKEIAFKDQETLHLGRDFSNDLVFTNASHISRNHCLITWYAQKQKFYIEDRSSNGCFINGASVRLPKNVEIALDPGTMIDIGDRANRFRLE